MAFLPSMESPKPKSNPKLAGGEIDRRFSDRPESTVGFWKVRRLGSERSNSK